MTSMMPQEAGKRSAHSAQDARGPHSGLDQNSEDSFNSGALVNPERATARGRGPRHRRRRKPVIIDGPFTESKEMLGGFSPPGSARR